MSHTFWLYKWRGYLSRRFEIHNWNDHNENERVFVYVCVYIYNISMSFFGCWDIIRRRGLCSLQVMTCLSYTLSHNKISALSYFGLHRQDRYLTNKHHHIHIHGCTTIFWLCLMILIEQHQKWKELWKTQKWMLRITLYMISN